MTLLGIVTPVRLLHRENAPWPIFVTLLPSISEGISASPTASYAAPTAGTFTGPPVESSLDYEITMAVDERPASAPPTGAAFARVR